MDSYRPGWAQARELPGGLGGRVGTWGFLVAMYYGDDDFDRSYDNLSHGQRIAIGVCVSIGGVILLVAIGYFISQYRSRPFLPRFRPGFSTGYYGGGQPYHPQPYPMAQQSQGGYPGPGVPWQPGPYTPAGGPDPQYAPPDHPPPTHQPENGGGPYAPPPGPPPGQAAGP